MLKKLSTEQLNEFSIWDWRPIAADTLLNVIRMHSADGALVPQVTKIEIGPLEWAHHYRFGDKLRDDLIIVFARGGRSTAFKRRSDPPAPLPDGMNKFDYGKEK